MLTVKAANIGRITQMRPGSRPAVSTNTSGLSRGMSGFGLRGGSPGGTALMSKDRYSENGEDVYKCYK